MANSSKASYMQAARRLGLNCTCKRLISSAGACPGCGAAFQRVHAARPGYLPPIDPRNSQESDQELEKLDFLTPKQAKTLMRLRAPKTIKCLNCHSLKNQNAAVVTRNYVSNIKVFEQFKMERRGLVVAVMDALDLPGSRILDLPDLIGQKELVIVLNKAVFTFNPGFAASRILLLQCERLGCQPELGKTCKRHSTYISKDRRWII